MTQTAPTAVTLAPRGTLPPIDSESYDGPMPVLAPNAPGNVQPLSREQVEVYEAQAARWAAQVEGLRRRVGELEAALLRERAQYQALVDTIGTWNNLVATVIAQRYSQ